MAGKGNGFFLGCLTTLTILVVLAGLFVGALYVFKEQIVKNSVGRLRPPAIAFDLTTDFELPVVTIEGDTVAPADLLTKPVVLHVWHPGCPECLSELAGFDALRRRLDGVDVVFLAVAGDQPEAAPAAAETYGYAGPLYKTTAPLPAPFDTEAVPMTYIIAPGGKIVHVERGSAQWDDDRAERLLRALAGEEAPATPADRAAQPDQADQTDQNGAAEQK